MNSLNNYISWYAYYGRPKEMANDHGTDAIIWTTSTNNVEIRSTHILIVADQMVDL